MITYYVKGQEKNPLYCVVYIFRAKMHYVILRGITKSLISGRMDVENSISTVIISDFNASNILSPVLVFLLNSFFNPLSVIYVAVVKELRVFLSCFYSSPHFFFCRLMCILDSLWGLYRPS